MIIDLYNFEILMRAICLAQERKEAEQKKDK